MKRIFTIIFLFFLSSCIFLTENNLSQTVDDNNFLNRFPENKKSIIILKLQGKKRDRIYLCEEKNVFESKLEGCRSIYATGQYSIVMLKAGNYYLFAKPENRPLLMQNKIDEKRKYFASLSLKSGEIIYIGDISYKSSINNDDESDFKDLGKKFTIQDNSKLIEAVLNGQKSSQKDKLFSNQIWEINYLIKNYPKLKNRFYKKLLK